MQKKPLKEITAGDHKEKQMILKLDPKKHSWVKSIAESTGMTQPNVVNLILSEATQKHPESYIAEIQKLNAKEALKKLDEIDQANEKERKRLEELLNH